VETSRYSISISHAYQDINIVLFSGSSKTIWLPVYLFIRRELDFEMERDPESCHDCLLTVETRLGNSDIFRRYKKVGRVFLRIDLEGNGDFLGL